VGDLWLMRALSGLGRGKHFSYFHVYERHLARFRDHSPVVLEIGIDEGTSLAMWREYFGPNARIYGIDIVDCSKINDSVIKTFKGDQSNTAFLYEVLEEIGPPDIVIDDGSHVQTHVRTSFEYLYPRMTRSGIYIVEDLHVVYPAYKDHPMGPFCADPKDSFMLYTKDRLDDLNTAFIDRSRASEFALTTLSIHAYESVVVFERGMPWRMR
jgi:cephalosporin hydroxylase